jgi:pyruvate kinase
MDVARLNFSHGTLAEHGEVIAAVREASRRVGRPVAILQDLAGPKVRTGPLAAGGVELKAGEKFVLTGRDVPGDADEVSVTYRALPGDVRVGDVLLLSDGALELVVEAVSGEDIVCRVVIGGALGAHKGINLPSRSLRVPFLTAKDEADIRFGIEQDVDYVALSFVRTIEDVNRAQNLIRQSGGRTPIIAKIEKHEALGDLDAILAAVDGIMVARGDLGVEIPIERVPRVQKMLIEKANSAAKLVITATQMLKSMVESPRPTRAEVTDVANAVIDGSDAVMLSEETAIGAFPEITVGMMARIAADAELGASYYGARGGTALALRYEGAVARAACQLAADVDAAAIITCTQSGSTTRLVAKYRPNQLLLALTPVPRTYRELALVWGVVPMMMESAAGQEEMERQAVRLALDCGRLKSGDMVVITAGLPLHVPGKTNAIKLIRL